MHLENRQEFKKFVSYPLIRMIENDFLSQKGDFEKVYRYEVELNDSYNDHSIASWLAAQKDPIKTYWSDRDKSFRIAGLGCADIFSNGVTKYSSCGHSIQEVFKSIEIRISNSNMPLRYFGCLAFDMGDEINQPWEYFGKFYFILPKAELYRMKNKYYFAVNIFYDPKNGKSIKELYNEIKEYIESINAFTSCTSDYLSEDKTISYLERMDNPDKTGWERNIEHAISNFDFEEIKKVVLSRRSVFKLEKDIDPLLLFLLLKKNNIKTYDFYFQNEKGHAFIGCSPELLFSRQERKIYSEAIAGTISLGKNIIEEKSLGEDLLKSKKDSDEYRFVFDSVKNDLEKICYDVNILKKKEILKLSYAQHIYSQFEGSLKPDINDFKIIAILNPTPAVSGYPKRNINSFIKRYETFFRGFYAGPVGWIGKNSCEFAVGIRSGVVSGKYLSVYSGAGIVKKSFAESEWNEIENKISPFLKILQNK